MTEMQKDYELLQIKKWEAMAPGCHANIEFKFKGDTVQICSISNRKCCYEKCHEHYWGRI